MDALQIQDRSRQNASVIGFAKRPVLIVATGLRFATRPNLYALTLYIMFRKNNLFFGTAPGIKANSNENYKRYNFQTFPSISGNFRKY